MNAVKHALAAPAPGRQAHWAEHVAIVERSADFGEHIDITEGPTGSTTSCSQRRLDCPVR